MTVLVNLKPLLVSNVPTCGPYNLVMAPACVLFFLLNFVVWRYHVLYVYERGHESNGAMWFTVVELMVRQCRLTSG